MSCLAATLATLAALAAADPRPVIIEVAAGAHDRRDTPIVVPLPPDLKGVAAFTLERPDDRRRVSGQLTTADAPEVAWRLDEPLPAGSTRRYRLAPASATEADPVIARPSTVAEPTGRGLEYAGGRRSHATLRLDGRPILGYHVAVTQPPTGIDPVFARSGFVHPLATRSGLVVTDDFPPDHAHQHGLFFAWVDTTFEGRHVDFWNQNALTGRLEHDPVGRGVSFAGGPVVADLVDGLRHDDLNPPEGPVKVLEETWRLRAYDIPGVVVLDFASEQSCAGPHPLTINKYHYGGLALRGNRAWFDPEARGNDPPDPSRSGRVDFLTSEGKHRGDGNHTRPRWVDLSGEVEGRMAGVTILDHPENFRFPQPVRLHPNKPYFCFAPCVLGAFEIAPGKAYISRYRLIVHDGPPDANLIERLWADYADPPAVRVIDER